MCIINIHWSDYCHIKQDVSRKELPTFQSLARSIIDWSVTRGFMFEETPDANALTSGGFCRIRTSGSVRRNSCGETREELPIAMGKNRLKRNESENRDRKRESIYNHLGRLTAFPAVVIRSAVNYKIYPWRSTKKTVACAANRQTASSPLPLFKFFSC